MRGAAALLILFFVLQCIFSFLWALSHKQTLHICTCSCFKWHSATTLQSFPSLFAEWQSVSVWVWQDRNLRMKDRCRTHGPPAAANYFSCLNINLWASYWQNTLCAFIYHIACFSFLFFLFFLRTWRPKIKDATVAGFFLKIGLWSQRHLPRLVCM